MLIISVIKYIKEFKGGKMKKNLLTYSGLLALILGAIIILWVSFSQAGSNPVVYILPHQDDELFLAGSIREHVAAGRNVHAVMVTDGSKSSALPPINTRLAKETGDYLTLSEFVEARNYEFIRSMTALGVPAKNIHFANKDIGKEYKDGEMTKAKATEVIDFYYKKFGNGSYKIITAGAGGNVSYLHTDHRAIFLAFRDYPSITDKRYYNDVPVTGITQTVQLTAAIQSKKKDALESYKIWKPTISMYSVGGTSVPSLFKYWQAHDKEYIIKPEGAAKIN
jgi:hypothetical protein